MYQFKADLDVLSVNYVKATKFGNIRTNFPNALRLSSLVFIKKNDETVALSECRETHLVLLRY